MVYALTTVLTSLSCFRIRLHSRIQLPLIDVRRADIALGRDFDTWFSANSEEPVFSMGMWREVRGGAEEAED